MKRPPAAATWLLNHLYVSRHTETVIGDLLERYQATPSALWYWRQALAAIVSSVADEIWTHKALAIRALLIGCAAAWLFGFLLYYVARGPVGTIVEALSGESRHIFFGTWGQCIALGGASWVVGRLHRENGGAMVFVFAGFLLVIRLPELHRLIVNASAEPRYVPAFRSFCWEESRIIVAVLIAGLSQARPRYQTANT